MVTKGYRKGVYDRVTKGTVTNSRRFLPIQHPGRVREFDFPVIILLFLWPIRISLRNASGGTLHDSPIDNRDKMTRVSLTSRDHADILILNAPDNMNVL
jgi:hypothetical protein